MIREWHIVELSETSKDELKTYYYDEKHGTNAIAPNHDDMVIAEAVCIQMKNQKKTLIFD